MEESLASQIQAVLRECPHVRSYRFSVMELPHIVIIEGIVRSYHHKQMVQEAILQFFRRTGKNFMLKNEVLVQMQW